MSTRKKPRMPSGLRYAAAKRLWRDVVADYNLRPDEVAILEQAVRACDQVEAIHQELTSTPLLSEGYKGQPVLHPLIGEVRRQRDTLRRLLNQLGLPDAPAVSKDPQAAGQSARARKAAEVRWGTRPS